MFGAGGGKCPTFYGLATPFLPLLRRARKNRRSRPSTMTLTGDVPPYHGAGRPGTRDRPGWPWSDTRPRDGPTARRRAADTRTLALRWQPSQFRVTHTVQWRHDQSINHAFLECGGPSNKITSGSTGNSLNSVADKLAYSKTFGKHWKKTISWQKSSQKCKNRINFNRNAITVACFLYTVRWKQCHFISCCVTYLNKCAQLMLNNDRRYKNRWLMGCVHSSTSGLFS